MVLVLKDADHILAAVNAVGRALPTMSAKSKAPTPRVQLLVVTRGGIAEYDTQSDR